jgi:16S rRNA G966 N2-methylase RsmD
LVADPFCGSGTTGIEAILQGRRTWQSDANRASILIARGKLAAVSGKCRQDEILEISASLRWEFARRHCYRDPSPEGTDPILADWYDADTLAQLRSLWQMIAGVQDSPTQAALEMIFSDTLFACASTVGSKTSTGKLRKHHWGWVADNVLPTPPIWHDAKRLFGERLSRLIQIVASSRILDTSTSTVKFEDVRCLSLSDNSVDLVITSPPYLGMIDYALAHRLTYLWFGWPLLQDRNVEIGARCRRNRRDEPQDYLAAIRVARDQIYRILRPGGFCAIVVGASRKHTDMAGRVLELFSGSMHSIWGPRKRVPVRRRVSERKGTEASELICVYRKQ